MKHTLKKLSDTQVEITVTASAEDLHEAKEVALKRLARELKVPGFRKGKVPANVAEKNLDPNVLGSETLQHAVNTTLEEVISVENVRVLDRPSINVTKFVPFTELEYEAKIDVLPEVKLGNYKKLKAKRTVAPVKDSDVNEVIDRVKQSLAEKKDVTRAAKLGDEVTIDFTGKKDGKAFDGGTAKDYELTLGSNSFIPGFEDALVGMKPGDSKDVPLTFPKDYQAENLKGQKVVFEVKLHKISEVSLPELTDELAKKVGPFKSVKDLTDDIRRELASQNEREANNMYQDELVKELVKASKIPVPQILVDDQMRSMLQDAKQNLMYRGQTPDEYMKQKGYADEAEWQEKELKDMAAKRVQAGLALAELAKVEDVEVSKDELEARLSEMAQQYPNAKEQLETPEVRADIVNRLVTEKTIEKLVDLNA